MQDARAPLASTWLAALLGVPLMNRDMLELNATQSGKQVSDTYNAVARRQNCALHSSDRFRDKVADIVERVVATRSCQWHIDNRKILDLSAFRSTRFIIWRCDRGPSDILVGRAVRGVLEIRIAKKLVDIVCACHCLCWLHMHSNLSSRCACHATC